MTGFETAAGVTFFTSLCYTKSMKQISRNNFIGSGIVIGVAVGIVLGMLLDNMATGLVLGLIGGIAIDNILFSKKKKSKRDRFLVRRYHHNNS